MKPGTTPQSTTIVGLLGIGTAVPPSVPQAIVAELSEEISCQDQQQRLWLRRVFSRSGVSARGSVLGTIGETDCLENLQQFYPRPTSNEDPGPTTAHRMQRYAIEAPIMAADASQEALAKSAVSAASITHLITVSCTGFFAPGLDVQLIRRLGLRPSVHRLHLGFMGCHAAMNALDAAHSIVQADADAMVLICCVELCSLHFAYGWSPEKIVANSLFGDGAAAVIMGAVKSGNKNALWTMHQSASLLLPNSLDAMTWTIGDHGFEMTLSASLPALVEQHVRPWCQEWLGNLNLSVKDIHHWAIHPGGPKIITAAANALELGEEAVRFSRNILAQQGNMSSTTVLFILRQMAEQNARGLCVGLAFGPGLMMEAVLLER